MKKTVSLKLNRDFRRLYYKGKCVACGYVVVYVKENRKDYNRLGLTCGKSVGKAVVRNRTKRLIRESHRIFEDRLKSGYDIVIFARARAAGKPLSAISKDVFYAFSKLDAVLKEEKNSIN